MTGLYSQLRSSSQYSSGVNTAGKQYSVSTREPALRSNLMAASPGSLYLLLIQKTCSPVETAKCGAGNHPETRACREGRIQDNTGPINLKVTLAHN